MSEPPPAYEHTPGQEEDGSGSNTPAGSIISHAGDRKRLLQRAESLRSTADDVDKRRSQLKRDYDAARRNREHWTAFRLKHEMERAEKETKELHAKAARRFYRGTLFLVVTSLSESSLSYSAQLEARAADGGCASAQGGGSTREGGTGPL